VVWSSGETRSHCHRIVDGLDAFDDRAAVCQRQPKTDQVSAIEN
jgi:hypothetical protein